MKRARQQARPPPTTRRAIDATRAARSLPYPARRRDAIRRLPAFRCTLRVAAPLVAALALHQPGPGLFLAVGAVSTGFGSFQGAYRGRAPTMLSCAAGMAISLFAGSLAGQSPIATTAVA